MIKVILEFENKKQAEVFYRWFKEYGFDELRQSDSVHDSLSIDDFYNEIYQSNKVSNEYYIQIK